MICATIHGPSLFDATRQLNYASNFADMAEFRIDLWGSHHLEEVEKLAQEHVDLPLIFTLKPYGKTTELKRVEEIEKLAHLHPTYFEIEESLPKDIQRSLALQFPDTRWILSKEFTNWSEEELTTAYEQMRREFPDHYLKFTVTTKDTLTVLQLSSWRVRQKDPHLILQGIGEGGSLSQLLSPVLQNPWIYAGVDEKKSSTEMLTAKTLREAYRMKKQREFDTFLAHLSPEGVGHPPVVAYNQLLEKEGLPVIYVRIETGHLEKAWKEILRLPIKGATFAAPYDGQILPFLDYIDPLALKGGVVDTVVIEGGLSYGFSVKSMDESKEGMEKNPEAFLARQLSTQFFLWFKREIAPEALL